MRNAWSWIVTGNAELQTSAFLKDVWRSHCLGKCASLDSTMTQCNTAHASLNHYRRLRTMDPRSWRRELQREDGNSETHKCTCQRGWRSICVTGWCTDKDVGNFGAWFWLVAFWEAREALGLVREKGSQLPRGWNPVNKNLFPSTLIVGSYVRTPGGQGPGCSATLYSYICLPNDHRERLWSG